MRQVDPGGVGAAEDPGYDHVRLRRDAGVLEVVIDRPDKANSLDAHAHDELDDAFDRFAADPSLRVAILTGAGTRAFCAGHDLASGPPGQGVTLPANGFGGLTFRRGLEKPVIAAVNGYAMGGGMELVLACHLAVASADAQLALSEVLVGMVAAGGGIARLPRQIPPKIAHELILTGRRISADEAMRWGLVNRVAPRGQALPAARVLAREVLAASPTSVRLSMRLLAQAAAQTDPLDAVEGTGDVLEELFASPDTAEGLRAFAESRQPRWQRGPR